MKATKRKIQNSEDLRDEMIDVFTDLRAKKVTLPMADGLANVAGKIIETVKLELMYAALTKERPTTSFLAHSTMPKTVSELIAIEPMKKAKSG